MRRILQIVGLLICIFMTSCGMIGMQKEVHVPSRVPNGWQGVRF